MSDKPFTPEQFRSLLIYIDARIEERIRTALDEDTFDAVEATERSFAELKRRVVGSAPPITTLEAIQCRSAQSPKT